MSPSNGIVQGVENERRLLRTGTLSCQVSAAFQKLDSEVFQPLLPAVLEQVAADYAAHGRQRTASHRQA